MASVYALTFALRQSITLLDTVMLFGVFALYLVRVSAEGDEDDDEGVPTSAMTVSNRSCGR